MRRSIAYLASGSAVLLIVGVGIYHVGQWSPAFDMASAATRKHNDAVRASAPFADRRDFDFAARGYLGTLRDPLIKAADGRLVWNLNAFRFLNGQAPPTANPSLWRQAQLLSKTGLFRVTDDIYQVRGFDLANITFVRGKTGWLVIDTLTSTETARAAYALVTQKLGKRPIVAILYTHPHVDHFGGTGGLITAEDRDSGRVPIIAPAGFVDAAVGENVIAGPAMARRSRYQFGTHLRKDPRGTIASGIGPALSIGTQTMMAPTRDVARTGQGMTLDGVRLRFQMTPGTEAPAEMNIAFPDWKVIDLAENANPTQHNILTPRGAVVRNASAWAGYLTQSMTMFAGAETLITSHGWPRFGAAQITDYLGKHRDAYAYLHDQTVRLMNDGLTGDEIAARLILPKMLRQEWYDRPYYGSLSFNARAVYQYYMGWYDGNPVHLEPLPPTEAGQRYVAALGGAAKVQALAQTAYDNGDYRWSSELLNKLVFAVPGNRAARTLLARSYEQLAYQSENALWRNIYLSGAQELRFGIVKARARVSQASLTTALPTSSLFDMLAVRLDADKVAAARVTLGFVFPDRGESVTVTVHNGVLLHHPGLPPPGADAVLTVARTDLVASMTGGASLLPKIASGQARISGSPRALKTFTGWFDVGQPDFAIVTP